MEEQSDAVKPSAKFRRILSRAAGWCLGLSGLVTLSGAPCPCCGQSACPTGAVGLGMVGAILALGAHAWKRITRS